MYKVFDCLYLNDVDLTPYTLRKRREALKASISDIHRRLEMHPYLEARQASEIDSVLRKVVAEASEGLVLKNPRSQYPPLIHTLRWAWPAPIRFATCSVCDH